MTDWPTISGNFGSPVNRTIASGAINVAGLRYVIVDGEGAADDLLEDMTGGEDGQFLVIEHAPSRTITIGFSSTIDLVNQEGNTIQIGNFITQAFAIYSATKGRWQVWDNQVHKSIMSENGQTEILAGATLLEAYVATSRKWYAQPRGTVIEQFPLFLSLTYLAPPADGDLAANELALWFDSTNAAAKLKLKGKSANGTVVTGEVAFAPVDSLSPTGAIAEAFPRRFADNSSAVLTSGAMHLLAIRLPVGLVVSNITFISGGTALVSGTNQWFALLDANRNFLMKTANATSAAWAANTAKTLALTASFTTTYDGIYYIGIVVTATTMPTLTGKSGNATANGLTPKLNGISTTGLTTPASGTSPATAIGNMAPTPYAYLS